MQKLFLSAACMALMAVGASAQTIINADFAANPPSTGWFIFHNGEQPVENYVAFNGNVATFSVASAGEANFYQEFTNLTPGVTYTFSVDISNLNLAAGGTALIWSKGFDTTGGGFGWLNEFPNESLVNGTNSISFTPTGDGTNRAYQIGVLFNNAAGSSLDFSNPVLVPEPSTYAFMLGLLGLALVIIRRRRA